MADLIQLRRDTAANWTAENPTLAQGEIGLELDTGLQKLGDGTTAWNSLAYHDTLPKTQSLTEINAALVDSDEIPVYDASATANRKSLLSRIWTYISGKITSTANTFTAKQEIRLTTEQLRLSYDETNYADFLSKNEGSFLCTLSGSSYRVASQASGLSFYIGNQSVLTGDVSLEIGQARTGNGNAYIDLISDTVNTDYGLRILRAGGENANSSLRTKGAGTLTIVTEGAGELNFGTNNTSRAVINSSGNVLIATGTDNASGAKLQVAGAITAGDGSASIPSYSNSDDPNTGIYFPAADSVGIAVGGADIARFSSNVLQLTKTTDIQVGASTIGWKDLTSDIQIRNNPATDPTWAQIGTSPFWAYRFDVGEKVWITFHINHDYYPGGQILLHTHWLSGGTNTTNTVKWQFTYSVMKGHNQTGGDLDTTGTVVSAETASGGQYRHMVSEIASSITVTNAEPDSLICVVVERITNGATDNTDNIFLLTVDCHYQTSRFASPNKTPNFYA